MATSPKPAVPEIMLDFPDALRQVIAGKHVTKLEWGDPGIYVSTEWWRGKIHLCITKPDTPPSALLVTDGDLFGKDWIVIEDNVH